MLDPYLRGGYAQRIGDDLRERCGISLTMRRDPGIDGDLARRLDRDTSPLDAMVSSGSGGFGKGRQADPKEGLIAAFAA